MKKLITGSVILALALTGAPQAAAFSSGSSGPVVDYPTAPTGPSYTEVVSAFDYGYGRYYQNLGYKWTASAENVLKNYVRASEERKPYILDNLHAEGIEITAHKHATADFKKVYDELMATPEQPRNYALFAVYVVYGRETTTTWALTTPIPS